jgi:reactive intermediate/imine deaminase
MNKLLPIKTENAPAAIGPYSQAIKAKDLIFISGQIPLDPSSMMVVKGGIEQQTYQVFKNLIAVADASDSSIDNAIKLTIYLTDLENFSIVNGIMKKFFSSPYPARATVEVSRLPKNVSIEIDAILSVSN